MKFKSFPRFVSSLARSGSVFLPGRRAGRGLVVAAGFFLMGAGNLFAQDTWNRLAAGTWDWNGSQLATAGAICS